MRAFIIPDTTVAGADESAGRLTEDAAIPEVASGEALVRVLRAGVCNTDLEILAG